MLIVDADVDIAEDQDEDESVIDVVDKGCDFAFSHFFWSNQTILLLLCSDLILFCYFVLQAECNICFEGLRGVDWEGRGLFEE